MTEAPTSEAISTQLQRIAMQRVRDGVLITVRAAKPCSEEPDALVAHVRICGSPGPVTARGHPTAPSGRALTLGRTDGLTKVLIDPESHRVLGAGIVGHGAGDLITEVIHAIEMGAVAEDLALTIHPHPTLSETVMEAAEAALGQSVHVHKRRR